MREGRGRCSGCGEGRGREGGITTLGVAVAAGSADKIHDSVWEGQDAEAADGDRPWHQNRAHVRSLR